MAMTEQDKKDLLYKVQSGKQLTTDEELLYLTEILGFEKSAAQRMLFINEHYSENFLID